MPDPIDIQAKLDEWLEQHPDLQRYVSAVYYIPGEDDVPEDVTHTVRLTSVAAAERALRVGFVVLPEFAAFLDALLAMIATQPH